MNKRSNLPRRAWAMGVAVCAHLLALLAMGWRIPKTPPPISADLLPPLEIQLVRPPVRQSAPARPASPKPSPSPPSAAARVLIAPTPAAPPLSAPEQLPPAAEADRNDPRLRNALRGLVGCADPAAYGLDREQREACDKRLAASKPAPVGRQFSAEELAQFDAENRYDPILVRKPHNGCLPRTANHPPAVIGGSVGPNGPPPGVRSGATTTFGVGCAWSF